MCYHLHLKAGAGSVPCSATNIHAGFSKLLKPAPFYKIQTFLQFLYLVVFVILDDAHGLYIHADNGVVRET